MKYYSTNNPALRSTLREAILLGLAPDGGLFMPEHIPVLDEHFWRAGKRELQETAFDVLSALLQEDVPQKRLREIVERVFNFPIPVIPVLPGINVLELYHGPSASFKDFGARFLAELLGYFAEGQGKEWTVLVATSGDTGSAVAQGFFGVPGVRVVILYPKGRVSALQEAQLTTLGGNVAALEVDGVFDDCQRLVKQAFADPELREVCSLTSANSISIGRLFPQMVYYVHGWLELDAPSDLLITVPSGNFGNLTAGLFAKRMGLPVEFLCAMNANDVVLDYLSSGQFAERASIATLSNAMDVGNPSNFARILDLCGNSVKTVRGEFLGVSITDEETRATIRQVYQQTGYVLDPHGAVGFTAAQRLRGSKTALVLETAHPAKFSEVVAQETGKDPLIPERLSACLTLAKEALSLPNSFHAFKHYLLS